MSLIMPWPGFSDATSGATKVYSVLTGGAVASQKEELANACWVVIGYGTSKLTASNGFGAGVDDDEDSTAIDQAVAAMCEFAGEPVPYGASGRRDWSKLIALAIKVLPLILAL